jgi:fused signal recognition particle receptor
MGLGGFFGKLKSALTKTKEVLVAPLQKVLSVFRKMDETVLAELEEALLGADVGFEATTRIVQDLRKAYKQGRLKESRDAVEFLKSEMKMLLKQDSAQVRWQPSGPTVILVAGVNGVGKTTSIGKLCKLFGSQGKKVIVAAADTFRAAAENQISVWAERGGAEVVRHQAGADPAAVCFDAAEAAVARGCDVLIIDTAGRQVTKENLMAELGKIRRVLEKKIPGAPHETLLVLDATTGQNALSQAAHFTEVSTLTGIFLAKLDGTAKGGVVFAIRNRFSVPVKFVGLGEQVDDIAVFSPEEFVDGLFEDVDVGRPAAS